MSSDNCFALLRAARIAIVEKEHRGDSNIDQTGWTWEMIEHCDLFQSLALARNKNMSYQARERSFIIALNRLLSMVSCHGKWLSIGTEKARI